MNRNLLVIILAGMAVLYASCSPCTKRVKCPAFDGTLMFAWFPYQQGNTYYFSDSAGNMDTLIIGTIEQTEPHQIEYQTGWNSKEKFCNVKGSIRSQTDAAHPGWLKMSLVHTQEGEFIYDRFQLSFAKLYTTYTLNEENEFTEIQEGTMGFSSEKFNTTDLNGVVYNNVVMVSTTDTAIAAEDGLDRLYFAKGKGIVGYRTYPAKQAFWLQ